MAIVNQSSTADRLRPILRQYCKFSFTWQVDANGHWTPQTTQRTLFSRGVDDTGNNFNDNGWSDTVNALGEASVEVTSVFKGGAFSDKDETILLACGFFVERNPRLGLTAAGVLNGWEVAGILPSRANGIEGADVAAIVDRLFVSAMSGCRMSLLPLGTNSGCSSFLGIPQLQLSGVGMDNGALANYGVAIPAARYTFAEDILIPANDNRDNDFQPNRIRLDFSANSLRLEKRATDPIRLATVILCLDLVCVADFARIRTTKDEKGAITAFEGLEEIDKAKIAQFRSCL